VYYWLQSAWYLNQTCRPYQTNLKSDLPSVPNQLGNQSSRTTLPFFLNAHNFAVFTKTAQFCRRHDFADRAQLCRLYNFARCLPLTAVVPTLRIAQLCQFHNFVVFTILHNFTTLLSRQLVILHYFPLKPSAQLCCLPTQTLNTWNICRICCNYEYEGVWY
jgi:hypothetical protein